MRTVTRSVVVLLLLLGAAGTYAQSITGTVSGTITDEQGGALPGATVTLTGKAGSRTTVSDAKGLFRFVGVDSGTYSVTVELTGFRTRKIDDIPVTIGKTADASFTMKVGGISESVDVLGESPLVDVTSSATDNNLSQDLLFNMPIRYGNVAGNLLNSLPGINSSSAYGGDASSGNALLIDGVDTRDPSGGTPWTFYNFNIVEEVQAVGIGAPAEFGSFSGAVINTLTKSGGNRYSGLFDVTFTNSDLAGDNIDQTTKTLNPALGDPAVTNKQLDFTTQLGGPLVKDKLFFFVSAQRYHLNQDPTGPRTESDEVSPRFNGKLTWQPTPNDILTGTVQFDSYNIYGRADLPAALTTDDLTNQEDAPEWVWLTSWRHLFGSRTFTEVKYTGWWGYYDLSPKVRAPQHYDGESGLYSVSQGWAYAADRGRHQVNASISHFAEKWGRHDFKFGVEIERSRTRDRNYYINGKYYYDYGGQPYLAYTGSQYDVSGRNHRESVFLQDAWKPGNRLTLNLGVRFDHLSGGAPGEDAVYSNTVIAPRLGFALDLTGKGTTVLKGSYSQYYEGIFQELYATATGGYADSVGWDMSGCPAYPTSGPTTAYSCPASAQVEISRLAQPIANVDPDIKHPRVDEYSLGLEHQFGANWRVSATGIYRENKNFMGRVLPDARWEQLTLNTTASTPITSGCDGCSAWPGGTVTAYRWSNRATTAENLLITNPDGFQYRDLSGNVLGTMHAYRKYKAAMFTVGRRLANRWQAQLSYVYSKTEGTVNNTSRSLFRSTSNFYETPTLGLVNSDGLSTNDRPHELKVFGGWEIPKIEVSLNASYRLLSGRVYAPFQVYSSSQINYSATAYYWAGSSGRSPFVDDRGSRRFPSERYLDLRIEKVFNIAGNHRLAIFGDFLNILDSGAVINRNARVPTVSVLLPDGSGDTVSVPFEAPTGIQAPRQLMLGARWSF